MAELGWVAVLLSVIIVGITLGRWSQRIEHRLALLEKDMHVLTQIHRQEVLGWYGGLTHNPNPRPIPPEKAGLLHKLDEMTLTAEEGARLKEMLKQELEEVRGKDPKMRVLAIELLIRLLDGMKKLELFVPSAQPPKE